MTVIMCGCQSGKRVLRCRIPTAQMWLFDFVICSAFFHAYKAWDILAWLAPELDWKSLFGLFFCFSPGASDIWDAAYYLGVFLYKRIYGSDLCICFYINGMLPYALIYSLSHVPMIPVAYSMSVHIDAFWNRMLRRAGTITSIHTAFSCDQSLF